MNAVGRIFPFITLRRPRKWGKVGAAPLRLAMLTVFLLAGACGQLPPMPAHVDIQEYQPIAFDQLQTSGPNRLNAGQKVRVPAYFWQFLTYDPAMVRNYPNLLRRPIRWYHLEWCSLYREADLRGYFDRVAMEPSQRELYRLQRLDHVMIYGQMAHLSPHLLYLQVHRIEKIVED